MPRICHEIFQEHAYILGQANVTLLAARRQEHQIKLEAEQARLAEQERLDKLSQEKARKQSEAFEKSKRDALLAITPDFLKYRPKDLNRQERQEQIQSYAKSMSPEMAKELFVYLSSYVLRGYRGEKQDHFLQHLYPIPGSQQKTNAAFDLRTNIREVFQIFRFYDQLRSTHYTINSLKLIVESHRMYRDPVFSHELPIYDYLIVPGIDAMSQQMSLLQFYKFFAEARAGNSFLSDPYFMTVMETHIRSLRTYELRREALHEYFAIVFRKALYLNLERAAHEGNGLSLRLQQELQEIQRSFEQLREENEFYFYRYRDLYLLSLDMINFLQRQDVNIDQLNHLKAFVEPELSPLLLNNDDFY